jgi:hypothetical protein
MRERRIATKQTIEDKNKAALKAFDTLSDRARAI